MIELNKQGRQFLSLNELSNGFLYQCTSTSLLILALKLVASFIPVDLNFLKEIRQ